MLCVLSILIWIFVRLLFKYLYKLIVMPQVASKKDNSFLFPVDSRAGLLYRNFMRQMYSRRRLRTLNGYVGLGPASTTEVGIVCIILSARVPYVLRRDREGRYQLIGSVVTCSVPNLLLDTVC